jgi:hypothetical protein
MVNSKSIVCTNARYLNRLIFSIIWDTSYKAEKDMNVKVVNCVKVARIVNQAFKLMPGD